MDVHRLKNSFSFNVTSDFDFPLACLRFNVPFMMDTEEQEQSAVKPEKGRMTDQMKCCRKVLKMLLSEEWTSIFWPFYKPVDAQILGLLEYQVIKYPMDLRTIKRKMDNHDYHTPDEFASDVRQIFTNCYKYDARNRGILIMAKLLLSLFEMQYARLIPDEPPTNDSDSNSQNVKTEGSALSMFNEMSSSSASENNFEEREKEHQSTLKPDKGRMTEQMKYCKSIIEDLLSRKYCDFAWLFYKPFDAHLLDLADYREIVKHPMDLGTVKRKMDNLEYRSPFEFASDVRLTFRNFYICKYPHSGISTAARKLQDVFEKMYERMPDDSPASDSDSNSQNDETNSAQSMPNEMLSSSTSENSLEEREEEHKSTQMPEEGRIAEQMKYCSYILEKLFSFVYAAFAWPFYKPVDTQLLDLIDRNRIIKHPMYLETIKRKMDNLEYHTPYEFASDVRLIIRNCYKYNHLRHGITYAAEALQLVFEKKYAKMPDEPPANDSYDSFQNEKTKDSAHNMSIEMASDSSSSILSEVNEGKKEKKLKILQEQNKEQDDIEEQMSLVHKNLSSVKAQLKMTEKTLEIVHELLETSNFSDENEESKSETDVQNQHDLEFVKRGARPKKLNRKHLKRSELLKKYLALKRLNESQEKTLADLRAASKVLAHRYYHKKHHKEKQTKCDNSCPYLKKGQSDLPSLASNPVTARANNLVIARQSKCKVQKDTRLIQSNQSERQPIFRKSRSLFRDLLIARHLKYDVRKEKEFTQSSQAGQQSVHRKPDISLEYLLKLQRRKHRFELLSKRRWLNNNVAQQGKSNTESSLNFESGVRL